MSERFGSAGEVDAARNIGANTSRKQIVLEKHYIPAEIAALWALSADTIRALFRNEPGVLRIERPETMRKRQYISLRIPESVVVRVGERLQARHQRRAA
jgi:hypothetical protein